MPSRVIDYTALWSSQKLEACSIWARREYPWLYGLADVNGSFEITNPRALWMQVAPIRPDLTYELLRKVLHEYRAHGVLFVWEVRGKVYGHWTGSDKPGRLPRPSQRKRFRWLAPVVPKKTLRLYQNRFASKQIHGDRDTRLRRAPVHSTGGGSKRKSNSDSDSNSKGKSERGARRKKRRASSAPSAMPATQAGDGTVIPMPLAFEGKQLRVSLLHDKLLDETFGHALNMKQIYTEADLWLVQTGKRRPNVLKFISNWCKKELRKMTEQHGGGYPVRKEAAVGKHNSEWLHVNTDKPREPLAKQAVLNQGRLLWEGILKVLAAHINPHTYHTWFTPTRVWDWDDNGKVLTIQAPSKTILHWLENDGHVYVADFSKGMMVCYVGPDGKT